MLSRFVFLGFFFFFFFFFVQRQVTQLFSRMTIDEIAQKERSLASEIEQKQHHLRALVQNQYRGLVDCSPLLVEMQALSRNVVHRIDTCRQSLKLAKDKQSAKTEEGKWKLAQKCRDVVRAPAEVWRLAGRGQWKKAAETELEGEKTWKELQEQPHIVATLPLLQDSPLGDGRLRQQLMDAGLAELEQPSQVEESLTRNILEMLKLLGMKDADKVLKNARQVALEKALKYEDWLKRAAGIILHCPGLKVLPEQLMVGKDLAALNTSMVELESTMDVWGDVLLPPVLHHVKLIVEDMLREKLSSVETIEQVETAMQEWNAQLKKWCLGSGWAKSLQAHASDCVEKMAQEVAHRWQIPAWKAWKIREDAETNCLNAAQRLRALNNSSIVKQLQAGHVRPLSRAAREALSKAGATISPVVNKSAVIAEGDDKWWVAWAYLASKRVVVNNVSPSNSATDSSPEYPSPSCILPLYKACEAMSKLSVIPPSWLGSLLLGWLSHNQHQYYTNEVKFTPQTHLDVLFLEEIYATIHHESLASSVSSALKALDLPPFRELPSWRKLAETLASAADVIEAAYSSLHAPKLAHAQVLRMSTLLAPLLGSMTVLSGIPHSAAKVSTLVVAPRTPYPFKLLPIAGRFSESSTTLPDEEDFEDGSSLTSSSPASAVPRGTSLFQRLGSGLW